MPVPKAIQQIIHEHHEHHHLDARTNLCTVLLGFDHLVGTAWVPRSVEGEAELWIIRFAQNPTGHSLYSALVTLDQSDTVDKCWRATLRPDRAPKGGLQRQIEGLLGNELPQRRQGNGSDL